MNLKYLGCLINITSCPVNEKNGTANGDIMLAHAGLRVRLPSRRICYSRILLQVNMALVEHEPVRGKMGGHVRTLGRFPRRLENKCPFHFLV